MKKQLPLRLQTCSFPLRRREARRACDAGSTAPPMSPCAAHHRHWSSTGRTSRQARDKGAVQYEGAVWSRLCPPNARANGGASPAGSHPWMQMMRRRTKRRPLQFSSREASQRHCGAWGAGRPLAESKGPPCAALYGEDSAWPISGESERKRTMMALGFPRLLP